MTNTGDDDALVGSPDCIAVGDRVVGGTMTVGTRVGELEGRLLGISDGVSEGAPDDISDESFTGKSDGLRDTSMNGFPDSELHGTPGVSGGMIEGTAFDKIWDCLILEEGVMPGTMVGISPSQLIVG